MISVAAFLPFYSCPLPRNHMVLFSGGWCPLLLFDCRLSFSFVFKVLCNKTIQWREVKCLAWLTLLKVISVVGFSPFLPRSWQIQNDLTLSIVILHEQMVVSQQETRKEWNRFLDRGASCEVAPVKHGGKGAAVSSVIPTSHHSLACGQAAGHCSEPTAADGRGAGNAAEPGADNATEGQGAGPGSQLL